MILADCAICGEEVDHEEWELDVNGKIVHWNCKRKCEEETS